MNLFDQISNDIKQAMLAREKVRLEALRAVKKEFLEAKTAKDANGELSEETSLKIIQKLIKQRKDSASIYAEQNRPELAEKELEEVAAIEIYLPKQMSAEELEKEVRAIILKVGANSPKEMGKVMPLANQSLGGRAEGKAISEMVKKILAN
ncbi:aspartyl-tRNA amidotransferase subunit B [Bacteroidales bacterium]|nr:aspartyl-tRNA amidotransferase subunit B [Bacteroidales bacterium]